MGSFLNVRIVIESNSFRKFKGVNSTMCCCSILLFCFFRFFLPVWSLTLSSSNGWWVKSISFFANYAGVVFANLYDGFRSTKNYFMFYGSLITQYPPKGYRVSESFFHFSFYTQFSFSVYTRSVWKHQSQVLLDAGSFRSSCGLFAGQLYSIHPVMNRYPSTARILSSPYQHNPSGQLQRYVPSFAQSQGTIYRWWVRHSSRLWSRCFHGLHDAKPKSSRQSPYRVVTGPRTNRLDRHHNGIADNVRPEAALKPRPDRLFFVPIFLTRWEGSPHRIRIP